MIETINNVIHSFFPNESWEILFLGNSFGEYISAVVVFLLFLILFKIFQSIILGALKRLTEKTETKLDDLFLQIVQSVRPPFYLFLAFYVAVQFLLLGNFIQETINILLLVWIVYQVVLAVQIALNFFIKSKQAKEEDEGTKNALKTGGNILKWLLWTVGTLFVLSNLGVEITSLIAGLGIGGVAVAFALQNILGDLFSSFAIYFDKPFRVGDFIVVGPHSGIVDQIGIKSTRIKALQGEEVVISNRELTSTRIQNFKKLKERRVTFSFGVTYETTTEKIKRIPKIIESVIEKVSDARFDRCHFVSFGDSALLFETVYYVTSSEYQKYMDTRHDINIGIKMAFESESIDMAYPTTTMHIAKT